MNNLILVNHDEYYFDGNVRFNEIIPLLRTYGFLDKYIITPDEVNEYLHPDNDILYTVTARIPPLESEAIEWLDSLNEIPADIIEKANNGNLKIAYFVGEIIALEPMKLVTQITKRLKDLGINKKYITIYTPNFDFEQEIYAPYKYIQYIPIFEMSYKRYLTDYYGIPTFDNVVKEVNLNPRSKQYTCLNHIQKIHRKIVGATLYNNGLIDKGYFSYHDTPTMFGAPELENFMDTTEFDKNIPFILDTTDEEEVNAHWKVEKHFFNDAYWNYVTESFVADHAVITEKTFKPIVNMQPFLIVAAPGALAALRRSGYRTFKLAISEQYDQIQNNVDRMKAVTDLMVDLANRNDEQHIKMQERLKPLLEHNQKVFFSKTWREFI